MQDKHARIKQNLFLKRDKQQTLTPAEQEISRRWAAVFAILIQNPFITTRELTAFIINGGIVTDNGALFKDDYKVKLFEPVSEATAYRDIREVQELVGDVRKVSKNYIRHLVYETAMVVIQKSMESGDYERVNAALNNLVKAYKLDKEDIDPMDWESLPQPSFEPSGDLALLGTENKITIAEYQRQRKQLHQRLNITIKPEEAQ